MMPIEYKIKELAESTLLEFNIQGGVLDVTELQDAVENAPQLPARKGVIISGRGPVWLFCALAHKYHYCTFVATFEPRMQAGVVVVTHVKDKKIGDLIPL